MDLVESQRGRKLIGRLERGSELVAAILEVCRERRVRAGELRAFGWLESVELREYDLRREAWSAARHLPSCTVVHLVGRVRERDGEPALDATCVVARGDQHVNGGHLVSAAVHSVEFVIDVWDDYPAVAASVNATTTPEPAPAPPPPANTEWAQVVSASTTRAQNEARLDREQDEADANEDLTEEPLRAGDIIEHPKFGRCDVERIEGEQEFAQVRLRNGRLIRLSLDVLQLRREGDEENRRHWRAVPPR